MKKWFEVKASADGSSAEIHIFDIIGGWIDDYWGADGLTTAKTFTEALAKLPDAVKTLKVRINSPGGDAFSGITIANALRSEQTRGRKVETIVEGLAASAASIIAMGGSTVRVSDNGLMMVHAPWTRAIGNARELRAAAETLDQLRDSLVATYQWHSKLTAEEIVALIDGADGQGTWLDADAAIEAGLAHEKVEGLKAAASIHPGAVSKLAIPDRFRARVDALLETPAPPPAPLAAAAAVDVLRMCREGGCLDVAEALVAEGATVEQVQARVSGERQARQRAQARESEIRALCDKAKQPDLAASYIVGGMAVEQVRAQLTLLTAKLDKVEIDGSLSPDQGTKKKAAIDVVAVYAGLNRLPKKE